VDVYVYSGNGQVGLDDYNVGVFAGTATITDDDTLNPAYTLNLDAAAVSSVLSQPGDWLGINFRMPNNQNGLATDQVSLDLFYA
jgi:hypothetical protein